VADYQWIPTAVALVAVGIAVWALRRSRRPAETVPAPAVVPAQGPDLADLVNQFKATMQDISKGQLDHFSRELAGLRTANDNGLERIRDSVGNTLDQRVSASFRTVSDRLEAMHQNFGAMQALAQDVSGLRRALTNVKVRGLLGESQLAAMLEQFLVPGQYEEQKRLKPDSREAVDFAVRMPGHGEEAVWVPIDAKYPQEDHQRLMDAQDGGDPEAVKKALAVLERRFVEQAKAIRDKYVTPPITTNFGVMYLPVEGLYAEALRIPGLMERLQREFQIVVMGPTTLCAFLNTLQVGFRSMAINQRSLDIWRLLGEVRTEHARYAEWVGSVQAKLRSTVDEMDKVGTRTTQMDRRLRRIDLLEAPVDPEVAAIAPHGAVGGGMPALDE
jgi:DNA recombination protein RmuC